MPSSARLQSSSGCRQDQPEIATAENLAQGFREMVKNRKAGDLEELNRQILAGCQADEARTVAGREQSVGAAMLIERAG